MLKEVLKKTKEVLGETKILNVLMAIITFFSITYIEILPAFSVAAWLILICLIIVFNKVNIFAKEFKKETLIFAILFAFLNMIGHVTYGLMSSNSLNLFREIIRPVNIIYFVGMFNFFLVILKLFYPKIYNFKLKNENSKVKNPKKMFLLMIALILICWLPYFIAFFPGILSYDSIEQLRFVINGFEAISDHHPVIHTIFLAIPYNIGYFLTGSVVVGVVFASILQMVIMAAIFSSFIIFLHNRKVNDKVLLGVFLFYAILPVHAFYSISMWKDIIFSGGVLLLSMEMVKLMEYNSNKNFKTKDLIVFILVSLLCAFFRNNGIYMYVIVAIFSFILFKNLRKKLVIAFIIIFGIFFVVKGPIFNYFNVKKSESVEYIGMPLQQIGRMAFKNVKFNDKEKELLNKLMPIDKMAMEYDPKKADGIKFSEYFNEDVFNDNKSDYFKLWLNLVRKHPDIAIESYLVSTVGYWYPSASHWTVFKFVYKNEFGLKNADIIPNLRPLMTKLESKSLPILNLEWSIGLCFWMILFMGSLAIKKQGFKYIAPYIPVLGVWITTMIASPVFCEFRYIYGAFTTLPLLVLMPYLNLKIKK